MRSSCPTCGTTYRIDPAKVPQSGVRARCVQCNGVFRVALESGTTSGAQPSAPAEQSGGFEQSPGVQPSSGVQSSAGRSDSTGEQPGSEQEPPLGGPAETTSPTEAYTTTGSTPDLETPAAEEGGAVSAQGEGLDSTARRTTPYPFGLADPQTRARRLARALVSDIVVYHPEKREASLRSRTLRVDFQDEIRKSWNEYVAQVGEPIARGTPYFREALNEILAGGERVF